MSAITTHVLDTALGRPAEGVTVRLDVMTDDGSFLTLAEHTTNADGRIASLLPRGAVEARTYRMTFDTGAYFSGLDRATFYPWVEVVFQIVYPRQHHHVPLLLNQFGYSTYLGS
jgi:5-hydroxyisourate hydrolase